MEAVPPPLSQEPDLRTATEKPWLFGGLLAGVVVVWLLFWVLIAVFIKDPDNRGVFGDMFGAANALFSGLAFACLVYAVALQRKELALQREDLKIQQRQLERSVTESAEQTKLMREELRLARERFDAEMQRIKNEGEPGLVWEPGHGTPAEHSYHFTSRGGRFRVIKISHHPGVDLVMHPPFGSLINYGDKGWLKVVPRRATLAQLPTLPSTPWWFTLHCRDQFGEMWHRDYRVENAGEGPFEQHPAQ